jgi:hypothetical protein
MSDETHTPAPWYVLVLENESTDPPPMMVLFLTTHRFAIVKVVSLYEVVPSKNIPAPCWQPIFDEKTVPKKEACEKRPTYNPPALYVRAMPPSTTLSFITRTD